MASSPLVGASGRILMPDLGNSIYQEFENMDAESYSLSIQTAEVGLSSFVQTTNHSRLIQKTLKGRVTNLLAGPGSSMETEKMPHLKQVDLILRADLVWPTRPLCNTNALAQHQQQRLIRRNPLKRLLVAYCNHLAS